MGSILKSILDVIADIASVVSLLALIGVIIRTPIIRAISGVALGISANVLFWYLAIGCCIETYHISLLAFIVSISTVGIGAIIIVLLQSIYRGEWGTFFFEIATFAYLFGTSKLGGKMADKATAEHERTKLP